MFFCHSVSKLNNRGHATFHYLGPYTIPRFEI